MNEALSNISLLPRDKEFSEIQLGVCFVRSVDVTKLSLTEYSKRLFAFDFLDYDYCDNNISLIKSKLKFVSRSCNIVWFWYSIFIFIVYILSSHDWSKWNVCCRKVFIDFM